MTRFQNLGNDFGSYGPNSFGIRTKNKLFIEINYVTPVEYMDVYNFALQYSIPHRYRTRYRIDFGG